MPNIFLSPATYSAEREAVQAECHGFEQYLIRSLTDLLELSLQDANISFARRATDSNVSEAIEQSNLGDYALHLALHVNMAPDCLSGALRGINVLYSPYDQEGKLIAEAIAAQLKTIYPLPDLVTIETSEAIEQLTAVNSPSVMLLLGYRDSAADAEWLQRSEGDIANIISQALESHFQVSIPQVDEHDLIIQPPLLPTPEPVSLYPSAPPEAAEAEPERRPKCRGLVRSAFGGLVIRKSPDSTSAILKTTPNGSILTILEDLGIWCLLQDGDVIGYAMTNSLLMESYADE